MNRNDSVESGAVLAEKFVYKDCITAPHNNQTDPSNPIYACRIMALDTIYQFDDTIIRGNSMDPETRWDRSKRRSFPSHGSHFGAQRSKRITLIRK